MTEHLLMQDRGCMWCGARMERTPTHWACVGCGQRILHTVGDAVPLLYWFWVQVGAVAALWLYQDVVMRVEDEDFAPLVAELWEDWRRWWREREASWGQGAA